MRTKILIGTLCGVIAILASCKESKRGRLIGQKFDDKLPLACILPNDCPGEDGPCRWRTCTEGSCGIDLVAEGTRVAQQVLSDCHDIICNNGATIMVANNDDVLSDGKECTHDTCENGTPLNAPMATGEPCTTDGGTRCDGAGRCVECLVGDDCASGVCNTNICVAPTCADNVANGSETDVDCGGTACFPCTDGLACLVGADCASGVCAGSVCQAPTCSDGVQNADETDVDCGGAACSACGPNLGCALDSDCIGGACSGSVCLPTCTDRIMNGNETDTDCGGLICATCADGLACLGGTDCASGVCAGSVCQAPTCSDGVQNADEFDLDCGGMGCAGVCGTCTHDICTQGAALENGCSPCVTTVCQQDDVCCVGLGGTSGAPYWDGLCVDEVAQFCGITCPSES